MRDDERFEIERSFDVLPHVVGSSWACVWFRLCGIKKPTRTEYRQKVLEFVRMLEPLFCSYPDDERFSGMNRYIAFRKKAEYDSIISGSNKEVEKRYDRYVDYG